MHRNIKNSYFLEYFINIIPFLKHNISNNIKVIESVVKILFITYHLNIHNFIQIDIQWFIIYMNTYQKYSI